ncbi:MAG: hypothetical protein JXN59_17630 [Anaerolineae bacterium]|nr:hypothetical protein [Anaerolineae bacterium]
MAAQEWHSLFLPLDDQHRIAETLAAVLVARGFTRYDPFPGGSGLAFGWKARVRYFVAPPLGGWTRILGACEPDVLTALVGALESNLLYVWLDEEGGGVCAWTPDGCDHDADTLADWLRPDAAVKDLRLAMEGDVLAPPLEQSGPEVLAVPLPPDMQDLAGQVDERAAEKLMEKLTRSVFGKLEGAGQQARADALKMVGGGVPWNSEAGRRIRAVMSCLGVLEGWHEPALEALSGAYQVARARQHNPAGGRLPGDDAALALVPEALGYVPVYAGRR